MRACVVGGGLAGALLVWRLAQAAPNWYLDLIAGRANGPDATAVSGGAVRSFETDFEQRRLAILSMAELLASRLLREWATYRRVAAVYLSRDQDAVTAAVHDIDRVLPGSVRLPTTTELAREGWANLTGDEAAVQEHHAGSISPARLRDSALADAVGRRVRVHATPIDSVTPRANGLVECVAAGGPREYDVVVVATGAWTAHLLRRSGLPAEGYRVKSIQYSVFPTGSWRPPQFVDEITGVYGLPLAGSELLLGAPSQEWDVDPDHPPTTAGLHQGAVDRARARFPRLSLGSARRRVGSADCYCDRPLLSLRRLADPDHLLFTFSGGAGGSAKTALAASHLAATQLTEFVQAVEADPSSKQREV